MDETINVRSSSMLCRKQFTVTNTNAMKDAVRQFGHPSLMVMLITDGAVTMNKAGRELKTYFTNIPFISHQKLLETTQKRFFLNHPRGLWMYADHNNYFIFILYYILKNK